MMPEVIFLKKKKGKSNNQEFTAEGV